MLSFTQRCIALLVTGAALLTLTACGDNNSPVGTWTVDKDTMRETILADGRERIERRIPDDRQAEAIATLEQNADEILAEFDLTWQLNDDGTATTTGSRMGRTQAGTGTWTRNDDGTISFSITDSESQQTYDMTGTIENGNLIITQKFLGREDTVTLKRD